MQLEFNTPYSAYYIGKPNLVSRDEPHIIYIRENRPYGIKVTTEETEIPYASLNSIERNWKINEK